MELSAKSEAYDTLLLDPFSSFSVGAGARVLPTAVCALASFSCRSTICDTA